MCEFEGYLATGDDNTVCTYIQTPANGFAGTAPGAFGSAQAGIPSTVIGPSLLLDDVEIRSFHDESRRLPLVPAHPLKSSCRRPPNRLAKILFLWYFVANAALRSNL
jgi:hypothetical protein